MPKIYDWEKIYKQALDEKDSAKRDTRIAAAEKVIQSRQKALAGQRTRLAVNELAYLQKAVARITKLRSAKLPAELPQT